MHVSLDFYANIITFWKWISSFLSTVISWHRLKDSSHNARFWKTKARVDKTFSYPTSLRQTVKFLPYLKNALLVLINSSQNQEDSRKERLEWSNQQMKQDGIESIPHRIRKLQEREIDLMILDQPTDEAGFNRKVYISLKVNALKLTAKNLRYLDTLN